MSHQTIDNEDVETHDIEILVKVDGKQYYRSLTNDETRQPIDDVVDWWKPSVQVAKQCRRIAAELESRTE